MREPAHLVCVSRRAWDMRAVADPLEADAPDLGAHGLALLCELLHRALLSPVLHGLPRCVSAACATQAAASHTTLPSPKLRSARPSLAAAPGYTARDVSTRPDVVRAERDRHWNLHSCHLFLLLLGDRRGPVPSGAVPAVPSVSAAAPAPARGPGAEVVP
eukprot:1402111-Rhodomonas_salina.2